MLALRIGLTGNLLRWAQTAPVAVHGALAAGIRALLEDVQQRATRRVSGQVLRVRTGHLRRSIGPVRITTEAQRIMGTLGVSATYAPYHEYGTPPYTIRPRTARVLAWRTATGARRFARIVRHPGLRPRPFFRPSWAEMLQSWKPRLLGAMQAALRAAAGRS